MNTSVLRNAIDNKEVLEFRFKGYLRVVEPHIYGIKSEKRMLLVFQIGGGTSSGSIPDWRLVPIDEITDLKKTGQSFSAGRELPKGDYSHWDVVISRSNNNSCS